MDEIEKRKCNEKRWLEQQRHDMTSTYREQSSIRFLQAVEGSKDIIYVQQ